MPFLKLFLDSAYSILQLFRRGRIVGCRKYGDMIPQSYDFSGKDIDLCNTVDFIAEKLNAVLGKRSVKIDKNFHMRPGDRFFASLQKGIPLRLELGEKEFGKEVLHAVRRDTGERFDIPWDEVATRVPEVLEDIQKNLYEKALAFREKNTIHVTGYEEFSKIFEGSGGFVEAFFAGGREEEKKIKEETGATVRCFPLGREETGTCFYTGKKGARLAVFAKSY